MDFSFDWDKIGDAFRTDGKVSYWKVLGGASAGVAAIVAAPIFGGVGAITLAGAAVGTAVGGLGGVAASFADDSESKAEKRGVERGRAEAAAVYSSRFDKLKERFEATVTKMASMNEFFSLIVALHAVGMACAACDGLVSDAERRDIEEFIGGMAVSNMPQTVVDQLNAIATNPPNIDTAFVLAQECHSADWGLFDEVISLVMNADGVATSEEVQFRAQWDALKRAA